METEDSKGRDTKLMGVVKALPGWIQAVVVVGSLLFGMGVLFNDVKTLKDRVDKSEGTDVQQAIMSSQISTLHDQLEQSNKTQVDTNGSVKELSDNVNQLGIAVSRLQVKLDDIPPAQPKKKK